MGGNHHRVDGPVRQCRMPPFAQNADLQFVGRGHVYAAAKPHHPGVDLGVDMLSDNAVDQGARSLARACDGGVGMECPFLYQY